MSNAPKYAEVDPDWLQPNSWNPNRMNAFMYAKELGSIRDHGMVDPVTVRELGPKRFEIIDGENRWRACRDLGKPKIPIFIIDVDDVEAKKLTILLNELRGQALPGEMGALIKDLLESMPLTELVDELPYTEEMLKGLMDLEPFDLSSMTGTKKTPGEVGEKQWVERLYRLPAEAAAVIDQAVHKAKEGETLEDWQGLERIAADYLSG